MGNQGDEDIDAISMVGVRVHLFPVTLLVDNTLFFANDAICWRRKRAGALLITIEADAMVMRFMV